MFYTKVFDQSERAQGPIYVIISNKALALVFDTLLTTSISRDQLVRLSLQGKGL